MGREESEKVSFRCSVIWMLFDQEKLMLWENCVIIVHTIISLQYGDPFLMISKDQSKT